MKLLALITKGSILDAAWVLDLPMPKVNKVEWNTND